MFCTKKSLMHEKITILPSFVQKCQLRKEARIKFLKGSRRCGGQKGVAKNAKKLRRCRDNTGRHLP